MLRPYFEKGKWFLYDTLDDKKKKQFKDKNDCITYFLLRKSYNEKLPALAVFMGEKVYDKWILGLDDTDKPAYHKAIDDMLTSFLTNPSK